jgi:predicted CXXCH cytochrome family protein
MKKQILIVITLLTLIGVSYSQTAKIWVESVSPYTWSSTPALIPDSSITTGNDVVGNGTFVYLRVSNIGDTNSITNAVWSFVSKPAGSNAALSSISGLQWWQKFKADVKGTYEVKVTMTTATGTKDTTRKVYSADYVGTGNFDNVAAQFPNCMTCHAGMTEFQNIFNRWKVSKHAKTFKYNVDSGSTSWGTTCFRCHTVGNNNRIVTNNHGFDDVASSLGWVWSNYSPPKPGNWDTIKTRFSSLVAFTGIGCESCHGPGSEHVSTIDTNKINTDMKSGKCGSCHDSPWRYPHFRQWENSLHSEVIWSTSFAQSTTGYNTLDNCIRCHDGRGYKNFTNGTPTYTTGMKQADLEMVGCASCHDPHGSTNEHQLRTRPTNSDTLATGYHYTEGGMGKTCMDCHKSRRNNVTYTQTRVNSAHWGTHHSPQADVLLGRNAAVFTNPYITGSHKNISNTCVTCHMAQTTDTGTVTRDKVGGHSMHLRYEATGYTHVKGCISCHPGVTKFEDFEAPADYDGDNQIEPWQDEVEGLITKVRIALPPAGIDSVSWQLIAADSFNVNLRKAYWNYQLIEYDGSKGMHNPFFAVNVLQATLVSLIGIEYQWTEVPTRYELTQNYPNPFNPVTRFTFSLPKTMDITIKIYDITGREIKTLVSGKINVGKYTVSWDGTNEYSNQVASGVYFYRFNAGDFTDVKKMVLLR